MKMGKGNGINFFYPAPIVSEQAVPAEFENTQDALFYDALIHFGDPEGAVLENYRYFLQLETQFPSGKFHFNLEGITREMDLI